MAPDLPDVGGGVDVGDDVGEDADVGSPDAAPDSGVVVGTGELGEACDAQAPCRPGLLCNAAGLCAASGAQGLGELCVVSDECEEGLACGLDGACGFGGELEEGALCLSGLECGGGLVCAQETGMGQCVAQGAGLVGASCATSASCRSGLVCVSSPDGARACQTARAASLRTFGGVTCATPDGNDPPLRAYFELPGGASSEFYRLPYPNDIRRVGERPNLLDHPTSGLQPELGVDVVGRLVQHLQQGQAGFGANQAVTFRFSGQIDYGTLTARGEDATLVVVDVTPDAPEFGRRQAVAWDAASGRTGYACHHRLTVRPSPGRPFLPGHTYAAVLTSGLLGEDGGPVLRESDFVTLLGAERPEGSRGEAWDAYAPLRAWIEAGGAEADALISATVWTVGDPLAVGRRLPEAVAAAAAPEVPEWTLCDAGVVSPCGGGPADARGIARACQAANAGFDELHGELRLPVFQTGVSPYVDAGGGVEVGADGVPVAQRQERACVAMTVPKGEVPEGGWPVVIYVHDTGESFRSHVPTLAERLSGVPLSGDGAAPGAITIGWEQVMHEGRRGGSALTPWELLANLRNPDALQGVRVQGASEVHAVLRWLEALVWEAGASPTGRALQINTRRVVVVGAGSGATYATLALPFAQTPRSAVLASAGAGVAYDWLDSRGPVDTGALLRRMVLDPDADASHPAVQLLQGWLDPVDAVHYVPLLSAPGPDREPKDVFVVLGMDDLYTPRAAQETLATGARVELVEPVLEPFAFGGVPSRPAPVSGNVEGEGGPWTAVARQYEAGGEDAHRVWSAQAWTDVEAFLVDALRGEVPRVRE